MRLMASLIPALVPSLLAAPAAGGTHDPAFRFDGLSAGGELWHGVACAGDLDADGRPDLAAGARFADPGGLSKAGSAFVFTFNPILTASSETFSVSAGGTIDYALDYPDADAGGKYGILLSARGTGPILFKGLRIPLTKDRFFLDSIRGKTPPPARNFQGVLDAQGRATAHLVAAAGSLPARLIGRTIFLAAVNQKLDFSSVARRIDFTP